MAEGGFSQILIVGIVALLIGASFGAGVVLLKQTNSTELSLREPEGSSEPRTARVNLPDEGSLSPDNHQQSLPQSPYQQSTPAPNFTSPTTSQAYGYRTPFYSKDGVSFEHYWPKDFYAPNMKSDETEIHIVNGSRNLVQFKNIKVGYFVDGVKASEKSGTWEKFPSRQSWEKLEYLNISPAYYKGEPLILKPGEKGKIHHHIQSSIDIPSAKDQRVKVNLVYTLGGEEFTLEKELVRDTPASERSGPQEDH